MAQASFGVIGLGTMGENLALNVEEHGFSVAVWNLEGDWTDRFLAANPGKRLVGTKTLAELVAALERPRRILVMIKAGAPVDATLEKLRPLCERGDVIIDGGNSWFEDTERRQAALAPTGIRFVGMGTSGGSEGARRGPSLMPGGERDAWDALRPVLEAIAAKTDSGPCVTWVGPGGSGHFVKMVHNGIEYGDMQLIAEAYDLLRRGLGLDVGAIADVFDVWNHGRLESFLVELTATVLRVRDDVTGRPLVDLVDDAAGQKGTGKWTAQVALDAGVPIPTITAAIDARFLSAHQAERRAASERLAGPRAAFSGDAKEFVAAVGDALYASKICSYAQGLGLIRAGSEARQWGVDLVEMARIWKGGCIIRARLLDDIMRAFQRQPALPSLVLDEELARALAEAQPRWRHAVAAAVELGVPAPALSASLAWYDGLRSARLPQHLTQAQRDAFGAHTYTRVDQPERGPIHTEWLK